MKKKIAIVITLVLIIALFFPIPLRFRDGGTVKYQAILYSISNVHRLTSTGNDVEYEDGFVIKILGIEVFNNVSS